MNVLKLIAGAVLKKGGATLVVWLLMMGVTVMAYMACGAPLRAHELRGMALVWAIPALLGAQIWKWLRNRRARTLANAVSSANGGKDHGR